MTVRAECAQLLTYLLHSLACKHLEVHAAAGEGGGSLLWGRRAHRRAGGQAGGTRRWWSESGRVLDRRVGHVLSEGRPA